VDQADRVDQHSAGMVAETGPVAYPPEAGTACLQAGSQPDRAVGMETAYRAAGRQRDLVAGKVAWARLVAEDLPACLAAGRACSAGD